MAEPGRAITTLIDFLQRPGRPWSFECVERGFGILILAARQRSSSGLFEVFLSVSVINEDELTLFIRKLYEFELTRS